MPDRTSQGTIAVLAAVLSLTFVAVLIAWGTGSWTGKDETSGVRPLVLQTAVGPATHPAIAYATSILDRAPLPRGAQLASPLPTPLIDGAGVLALPSLVDVHCTYLLPRQANIGRFVQTHAPRGASSTGDQFGVGPNNVYEAGYSLSLPTTNRHAAYILLDYSQGASSTGRGELRVDVHVEWAPIRTVHIPKGTITITGYRALSYANPVSGGPVTATLTPWQADRLRGVRASLANAPNGGICVDDMKLYTISVAPSQTKAVTWTASGWECRQELAVGPLGLGRGPSSRSAIPLDDACSIRRLVRAWLPRISASWRQAMFFDCPPGA
jgi:hypothetical protein